jgi:hypothetical protein
VIKNQLFNYVLLSAVSINSHSDYLITPKCVHRRFKNSRFMACSLPIKMCTHHIVREKESKHLPKETSACTNCNVSS